MRPLLIAALLATVPMPPALAQPAVRQAPDAALDGRAIITRAYEAAGGSAWADVRTLRLAGHAVFYGEGATPRTRAERYEMWREYETTRASAHEASGKVLINAWAGGRRIIHVGSDGSRSWNEKGIIPQAEADAFWASNFGFGVIRYALQPGFTLTRLPDDSIDGHPSFMVRVTDPAGTATLFGIDKTSHFIRLAGFVTPAGYHVRIYDDFVTAPGWTQARKVTLYYNGVMANQLFWTDWEINPTLPADLFLPEASSAAPGSAQR